MSAAVSAFLTSCRARALSPRTVEYYGFFLVRLESAFEDPLGVALDGVRGFVASFSSWSVSSRRGMVRTLKLFYRFHGRAELADGLVMPRKEHLLPDALRPVELSALLGAVRGHARDWALVLVLLDAGLRRSEISALDVQDLDLGAGWVIVRKGKGRKARVCPLGRVAVGAVRVYVGDRVEGPLFLAMDGQRLRGEGVRKVVWRAGRRAGLARRVYPHLLRHTCATSYLVNGGDVFTLQALLGHSDPRITQGYVQLSGQLLKSRHRLASPADHAVRELTQARLW